MRLARRYRTLRRRYGRHLYREAGVRPVDELLAPLGILVGLLAPLNRGVDVGGGLVVGVRLTWSMSHLLEGRDS